MKAIEKGEQQREVAGWCTQFGLLYKRSLLNLLRIPNTSYVKVIVTVLTALFCIALFYGVRARRLTCADREGQGEHLEQKRRTVLHHDHDIF